jgi:GMP synthase PP-ATPase subunit
MSFLGKVFGIKKEKKQTYSQDNKFKLCVVDETSTKLHTMLGITDERGKELAELVIESYEKHDSYIPAIQYVLDGCNHINEVVIALTALHRRVELGNGDSHMQYLAEILRKHVGR